MKIHQTWLKRLCTIILSAAMLFGFMPTTTYALNNHGIMPAVNRDDVTGLGTINDPYIVVNWEGLKTCLNASGNNANGTTVNIQIGKSFTELSASEIIVDPEGDCKDYVLDLHGNTLVIQSPDNQPFTVKNGVNFIIKDSIGDGMILDQSNKNQIFYVKKGYLYIYDGAYQADYSKYVVHNENGHIYFYGGSYIAFNKNGATIYAHGSEAGVYIRKGFFVQHANNADTPVLQCERWITDDKISPVIWINNREDEIYFKKLNGKGTLLKSGNNMLSLTQGTVDGSFDYQLDGTWIDNEITGSTLIGSDLRVAYQTQHKPVIQNEPSDLTLKPYERGSFGTYADDADSYEWFVCDAETGQPYTREWVEQNAEIEKWTGLPFYIAPYSTALNGVGVYCKITNDAGSVYTRTAILTVTSSGSVPVITRDPQKATVEVGQTATFEVSVDGDYDRGEWFLCDGGGQEWEYNEIKDHATFSGWYDETFTITPKDTFLDGSRVYFYCENEYGEVESDYAYLNVKEKTAQFTDVKPGEYYYDAVMWAVNKGITSGTSKTTFSPDAECTRAQVATFLWRAAGSPEPKTTTNPFTDVYNSGQMKPFYKAILWAYENGITSGTSKTLFSPNATCTRAQIVTFLYRYAGSPSVSGTNPFTDVHNSGSMKPFYYPILWAVQKGITSGTSKTKFSPDAVCTRAQVVTFLYRMMK